MGIGTRLKIKNICAQKIRKTFWQHIRCTQDTTQNDAGCRGSYGIRRAVREINKIHNDTQHKALHMGENQNTILFGERNVNTRERESEKLCVMRANAFWCTQQRQTKENGNIFMWFRWMCSFYIDAARKLHLLVGHNRRQSKSFKSRRVSIHSFNIFERFTITFAIKINF